jgi:glycine dehydrogenase subunit 1
MMAEIGIRSVDELFAQIPPEARLNRDLNLPAAKSEVEIIDWFRQRADENGDHYTILVGAGAYRHYRPVLIDSLISRSEFFTAYTPYQPEISQGTLLPITPAPALFAVEDTIGHLRSAKPLFSVKDHPDSTKEE